MREAPQWGVWGLLLAGPRGRGPSPAPPTHPPSPSRNCWQTPGSLTGTAQRSLQTLRGTPRPRSTLPAAVCPAHTASPAQGRPQCHPQGPAGLSAWGGTQALAQGGAVALRPKTVSGQRSGITLSFSILSVSPSSACPSWTRPSPRPCTWPTHWGSPLTCPFRPPGPLRGQEQRPGPRPCSEALCILESKDSPEQGTVV